MSGPVDADFWFPFDNGYLPMKVVQVEILQQRDGYGPEAVELRIRAISVGAPVREQPALWDRPT